MVHTWRKLSHIRQTLREGHGGMCFGWEFVLQGKLSYILEAEHCAENIRRIGSTWERTEQSRAQALSIYLLKYCRLAAICTTPTSHTKLTMRLHACKVPSSSFLPSIFFL